MSARFSGTLLIVAFSMLLDIAVAVTAFPTLYPTSATPTVPAPVRSSVNAITTVAGISGTTTNSGTSSKATSATFYGVTDMVVDSSGYIYVTERYAHCVRRFPTSTSVVEVFAGKCSQTAASFSGVRASSATVRSPWALTIDTQGSLYVSMEDDDMVSKVSSDLMINTYIGTGASTTTSADGAPATSSSFYGTGGIWIDSLGVLYVIVEFSYLLKKIGTDGIVSTVAGNGVRSSNGNGVMATSASIHTCNFVSGDSLGTIYLSESG